MEGHGDAWLRRWIGLVAGRVQGLLALDMFGIVIREVEIEYCRWFEAGWCQGG
jgi:hypothetical protein